MLFVIVLMTGFHLFFDFVAFLFVFYINSSFKEKTLFINILLTEEFWELKVHAS